VEQAKASSRRFRVRVLRNTLAVLVGVVCVSEYFTPGLFKEMQNYLGSEPNNNFEQEQFPISHRYLDAFVKDPNAHISLTGSEGDPVKDRELIEKIPSWSQIEENYGPQPVISGLDHCTAFRRRNNGKDVIIELSGKPTTGLELLGKPLQNCDVPIIAYPWTERMASLSDVSDGRVQQHLNGHILQVVTTKDPFHWVQDMCRKSFEKKSDCTDIDPRTGKFNYEQFVAIWNEWNEKHLIKGMEQPSLIVRYEDILFHSRQVVESICECAGGTMRPFPFDGHFSRDTLRRIVKNGHVASRIGDFTIEELVQQGKPLEVNTDVMRTFSYSHPHFRV